MAVSDKTHQVCQQEPYGGDIAPTPPRIEIALKDAAAFDCAGDRRRTPAETQGAQYADTVMNDSQCCTPGTDGC